MKQSLQHHIDLLLSRYPALETCRGSILQAYDILETCFASGHKLLVAGNGGSCADSEHIVGELMKGFKLPRNCSEAFAALKDVYDHRDREAAKWRAAGKKVIGELGCDVPDELIIAAGMLPVQIYADPQRPLTETDKYLEYAFDPAVRAQFEKIVDGTYYDQIDALAISNSTDVIIRVFLYLREIHRVEPEKPVPPVAFERLLSTR